MKALKNHPFAVSAFFERSTVLTFAIPKDQLLSFIPDCLELDTFQDKWAFIAVAMVQTKNLRPTGTPEILGNDFFLIGYRIFVCTIATAMKAHLSWKVSSSRQSGINDNNSSLGMAKVSTVDRSKNADTAKG